MSMKKKLILAYPNMRWLKDDITTTWNLNPATLCLLAAMIEDLVDIKIIDAQFYNMSEDEFEREIAAYKPDYVGFSLLSSEYRETLDKAINIVKNIDKKIIVFAGGVHVTTQFGYAMRNRNLDYCIRGEGEYVLRELIKYLNNNGKFPAEGMVYRKDGKIVAQEKAIVDDMTKLPWPKYELIDFDAYARTEARRNTPNRAPEYPYTRMITTRGCPFGCSFCQVETISTKRVRARDPEDVINELEFLKRKYGIKSIIFDEDNLLLAPKGYAKRLFSLMIERKLNLKWVFQPTLALLNDELLDLMRDAGCVIMNVAIESGNPRVLKQVIGKPIKDINKVPGIIAKIKERGMSCIANFIIGFPGETWDEIRQTIKFAENCGADYIKIFVAVPLHGTKLFEIASQMGYLEQNDEFLMIDWRYGQITSEEWTAKDVSILRAYEWDRINFAPDRIKKVAEIWGVDEEELKKIRKKTRDALSLEKH